jgi:MFS family permease
MKIYYGWIIVAVAVVVTCVGFGSMLTLSVFLQPIATEMGWSRTAIASVGMLNFLCMGAGAFMWGTLTDRYGARFVLLTGGALLGLGLVTASLAASLLQFQIFFGALVGVAAGSMYAPVIATITRWFTTNRTLAVALASAGLSLGSTVMAPLARWLISTYDWRTAMLVIGDVVWVIVLPAALLVRKPPASVPAAASAVAVAQQRDFTMSQVIRTPQFAAIALAHFACCAAHSGPIFHMVTHAMDTGVPAMAAATVLSVAGLASLTGRVACGIFADRFGAKQTVVACLALQAFAISLYLFANSLSGLYLVAMVFGFSYGGVMPVYAVVVREYFGEKVIGSAFGAVSLVATLGMALGPLAGGWLYDNFGSYFWMFAGAAMIGAAAVAVAVTFRPPRVPAAMATAPSPAG